MKVKPLIMTALAGVLFPSQAFAVCVKPTNPEIPSGDAASGADMLKAKKAVETFVEETNKYLECGVDALNQKRAIDEMEDIAAAFNEQLRIYKAKAG
ncbi:MAG: hypothetical protein ACO1PZ_04325 [Gammaproteobacteria bacterium]